MAKQELSPMIGEAVSALMDNESSELEFRRLLKQLENDSTVGETWSRYHLIGASLKAEPQHYLPSSFAASIHDAIANEATYGEQVSSIESTIESAKVQTVSTPWWQHLGRAAIAASVAGALVIGVQQYSGEQNGAALEMAATAVPQAQQADLPSGINAPALSARTVAVQSGYDSRPQESRRVMFVPRQDAAPIYNEDVSIYVNGLIEEHSGNAAANTHQGMLPFTRIILTEED
jgi:sigma-E factor negative regulatory protein RseA